MHNKMGFTIMEILTVTAIIAILAAIAMPGFIGWRNNAQLGRAARDVYSSFQKAKMESVRRNVNCGVEFRTNDYVVYSDLDSSFNFSGPNEEIKTVNWSEYPGVRLDLTEGGGDGLTFANPNSGILFASDGLPRNSAGGLGSGTVFITFQNSSRQNTVTISTAGNIQIN
ncbi:MAG: GspH/FimT family protein [Desulfobacterales bacterium]|jgi:prepilin-type N-terminal cleavage/methylation domain-containing protein